jgi:hypothetical protein
MVVVVVVINLHLNINGTNFTVFGVRIIIDIDFTAQGRSSSRWLRNRFQEYHSYISHQALRQLAGFRYQVFVEICTMESGVPLAGV